MNPTIVRSVSHEDGECSGSNPVGSVFPLASTARDADALRPDGTFCCFQLVGLGLVVIGARSCGFVSIRDVDANFALIVRQARTRGQSRSCFFPFYVCLWLAEDAGGEQRAASKLEISVSSESRDLAVHRRGCGRTYFTIEFLLALFYVARWVIVWRLVCARHGVNRFNRFGDDPIHRSAVVISSRLQRCWCITILYVRRWSLPGF